MSKSWPERPDDIEGLVRVGDVLSGKYRIEKLLGVGGMGVVVAATHQQLQETVAIKLMLPDAAKSNDVVERFMREARAAVKIKSEHVARVMDVATLDTGIPYMVMEHLVGSDLSDVLKAEGKLAVPAAVEYVLQACEALAEAHAASIVHRDLKPSNLFLTRRADGSPLVKLLDFGISKVTTNEGKNLTKTSAVMGSPLYMSPEQMRTPRGVDARTDIWALGAILFELLTGDPPFDADTIPQLCVKIMHEPVPPLAQYRNDVPPALEEVIRRCLEKDPNLRYRHVGELGEALIPFTSGRALMSAQRVVEVARATGLANSASQLGLSQSQMTPQNQLPAVSSTNSAVKTSASWSGTLIPIRRSPLTVAIAAILALGALAAGIALGVGLLKSKTETAQPEVPSPVVQGAPTPAATDVPSEMPSVQPAVATTSEPTTPSAQPSTTSSATTNSTSGKISTQPKVPVSHPTSTKRPSNDDNLFNDRTQ